MLETPSATIRYETSGDGPAVLLLAPGGVRASCVEAWERAPWNPIEQLEEGFHIVAMDQRNCGRSTAPVTASDGWSSYMGDQLAIMDHLGADRFAVVGMCIGGAFIASLLDQVPDRVTAAVAMQPIGRHDNVGGFRQAFDDWRQAIAGDHPEATDAVWESVWSNLYGTDNLLWSVTDDRMAAMETPLLVLQGDDHFHPKVASQQLAENAPNATLIERWKGDDDVAEARAAVHAFLRSHAT